MEHHKEVAKHDDLNINGTRSDERRITRMRNWLVVEDGREDINEKADAFIKNFRHQLKIQRQDSLKRFQEMISRGADRNDQAWVTAKDAVHDPNSQLAMEIA
ncbi:hypothetical protein NC651_000165 [Populus alba x Populus x berolinensis]|nr:hypothetical protein NC651_000165 [Populus alba x Populus x berolinensis]